MKRSELSLAAGFVGALPVKLQILAGGEVWLALTKPSGVITHPHPLFPEVPSLTVALRESGKSLPLPARYVPRESPPPQSAFLLEPDCEGVALLGWDGEWLRRIREEIGSCLAEFRFEFLAVDRSPDAGAERTCELPIQHQPGLNPPVRISHRHGKKARTVLKRLGVWPEIGVSRWQACCTFLRPYQIRIHAFESGLDIPGDTIWGTAECLRRELFHRRKTGSDMPFFDGLPIDLAEIDFSATPAAADGLLPERIVHPPTRKWIEFVRKAGAVNGRVFDFPAKRLYTQD